MKRFKSFFSTRKVPKIIIILLIVILFMVGVLYFFSPTRGFIKKLNKINGTSYNISKGNETIAYNNNCRVAVYPTSHLVEPDLNQVNDNQRIIGLWVDSTKSNQGSLSISVVAQDSQNEVVQRLNELKDAKEPKISGEYNTLNYFIYNGRNYYYNINPSGFMITTPINENYLYWVMGMNYNHLTKEDIESILYFEELK